jgi:hypothetical protein
MHILSAALFLLATAAVQTLPPKAAGVEARTETKHLTVATSSTVAARRVSLLVDVTPKPKMHVYAPGQDGYISISLTLDPDPAFTAGKPKYPAGEKVLIEILKETQIVYGKPFRIAQDVTLRPRAAGAKDASPLIIKGTLRYQACDDKICYLPTNVPVQWTIK